MGYRKWDAKTKARIVIEGLQSNGELAQVCNKYQISQGQYYGWQKELEGKAYSVFETNKQTKRETQLKEENLKLRWIIGDLTIELKKSELELEGLSQ